MQFAESGQERGWIPSVERSGRKGMVKSSKEGPQEKPFVGGEEERVRKSGSHYIIFQVRILLAKSILTMSP